MSNDATVTVFGVVVGIVSYFISIAVALSPLGEYIGRLLNGCKEIKDPEILRRIEPLFDELFTKAKKKTPELSDKIKIYLCHREEPNAFACGRSTICITYGLLDLSDDDIKGILGHEFGHLANKDTDILQLIIVGNLIVNVLFFAIKLTIKVLLLFIRLFLHISIAIVSRSIAAQLMTWITGGITRYIIDGLLSLIMIGWTKLGVMICMSSSRMNEYLADQYAYRLGYGVLLRNALKRLPINNPRKTDVWTVLNSSHPDTIDRIEKLNILIFR